MKREIYFAPAIEEILMEVENGIANSTTEGGSGWGEPGTDVEDDYTGSI